MTATAGRLHARNQDKVLMLLSTGARMGVGMLTFVLLARFLGPASYGVIATAIAYATFTSLLTDFGFTLSILRKAAADPDQSEGYVWQALQAKAVLTLGAACLGALILWFLVPNADPLVYGLVFIGALAYSSADIIMICARARRRFLVETKLVIASSLIMLLLLGSTAAITRDITMTATAFACSRLLYLALAVAALLPFDAVDLDFSHLGQTLKDSFSFACDHILTALSTQADLLIFGALLVAHDIGIYQAGARLVQATIPFAGVLSTVYLPTLIGALSAEDKVGFRTNARRLTIEFLALSTIGGLAFAFIGPIFTRIVYGPAYEALVPLWGGFAAFVVLRFGSAAYGIQLAAYKRILSRILANLVSIASLAVGAAVLLPHAGLTAAPLLLALSNAPSFLILAFSTWKMDRSLWSIPQTAIMTMIVALLILVWGI